MPDAQNSPQPKYVLIAERLRRAIDEQWDGYAHGERLPGEDALAKKFGVAPTTLNRAVELLKQFGYLIGRKGGGVFVQASLPMRRRGLFPRPGPPGGTLKVWETADSQSLDMDQASVSVVAAPPRIAAVLALAADDTVLLHSRRFLAEGRPVKVVRTYLPYVLAAGTPVARPDATPGDLKVLLTELGYPSVHIHEEVRGRAPSTDDADRLSIPVGRFVLDAYVVAFDAEGHPVGVEHETMDIASWVLDADYDI